MRRYTIQSSRGHEQPFSEISYLSYHKMSPGSAEMGHVLYLTRNELLVGMEYNNNSTASTILYYMHVIL